MIQSPDNNNSLSSVQETLMNILNPLLIGSNRLQDTTKKSIDIRVCGRTDSGVSAISQVCRVRTLQREIGPDDIKYAINRWALYGGVNEPPSAQITPTLWCTDVKEVNKLFHPTFDATCRAYAYLVDGDGLQQITQCRKGIPLDKIAILLNAMLSQIEGKTLDYFSMSYGKKKTQTTLCTLFRARASVVQVKEGTRSENTSQVSIHGLCIELVGDRFLVCNSFSLSSKDYYQNFMF